MWYMGFSMQWLLLLWRTKSRSAGFSSCGAWVLLPQGTWDLPRPGIQLMSPASAGGFLTTGLPRKSKHLSFFLSFCPSLISLSPFLSLLVQARSSPFVSVIYLTCPLHQKALVHPKPNMSQTECLHTFLRGEQLLTFP